MREIAKLVDMIDDEIDGCEKYAQAAIKAKENGEMEESRTYCEMAHQECEHAEKLHGIAVMLIQKAKDGGATPTQGMVDVWNCKHDAYIARLAEAKVMLQMC